MMLGGVAASAFAARQIMQSHRSIARIGEVSIEKLDWRPCPL
jgi:hypothetical protein